MKIIAVLSLLFSAQALAICDSYTYIKAPKLLLEEGYAKYTDKFPTQYSNDLKLKDVNIALKDPSCYSRNMEKLSPQVAKNYEYSITEIYENVNPQNAQEHIATFVIEYADDSESRMFETMGEEESMNYGRPADYICYTQIQFECALLDKRKVDSSPRKKVAKDVEGRATAPSSLKKSDSK